MLRCTMGWRKKWRSFEVAREFVRKLGLSGADDWRAYTKGELPGFKPKPTNIPAAPHEVYKNAGWAGYVDWLFPDGERFLEFDDARDFVHNLRLPSFRAWRAYCRGAIPELGIKMASIPAAPNTVLAYSRLWRGYRDWLGTDETPRRYRSFKEARAYVHLLGLNNLRDWRIYIFGGRSDLDPLPADIPTVPSWVYRNKGWQGTKDWLKSRRKRRSWRPFKEARAFVSKFQLGGFHEWIAFCRGERPDLGTLPTDIPVRPEAVYKQAGWNGYPDWLGKKVGIPYRSFEAACSFARTLGLDSLREWRQYVRGERLDIEPLPHDIPRSPNVSYRLKGWMGWGAFLGTGRIATQKRVFLPFDKARAFARTLGLTTGSEWAAYARGELDIKPPRPTDVPIAPKTVYWKKGWRGWGDWLGTGTVSPRDRAFKPFKEARTFAHSLGLKSTTQWWGYSRGDRPDLGTRPIDIPSSPDKAYCDKGWVSWPDFLGTTK